ncbi:hypothetical protein NSQ29_22445 [Paenibacillus sp. FSL F4-0236]|uniref:hypothetical protein n=1 Tax=Paenibacillus sp. FSL F4-0236 TaxID=2954731 RepID=UPI0030F571FB
MKQQLGLWTQALYKTPRVNLLHIPNCAEDSFVSAAGSSGWGFSRTTSRRVDLR